MAFGLNDYSNPGLDATITDLGLGDVTGNSLDNGKVKVPSLRNIALTGPYMHDGRFKTLDEVVEHYNSGIQANPNLDSRLTQSAWGIAPSNAPVKMNMTDQQKKALVAFLNTFTDNQFVTDPRFSDPFK
jgi:cytochrome c peroxidase